MMLYIALDAEGEYFDYLDARDWLDLVQFAVALLGQLIL
jgi:hypothetical protein